MVELVDMLVLETSVERRVGSSPTSGTIYVGDSSIGRASDCDSEGCGFKARSPPQILSRYC